jgi:putative FmdB family regulatory protein
VPIYGYRCTNCGHEFEIQQRISAEPLKACPKCQGKLTKLLYPAGVIFKGSGFYSTDYKGSSKSSDNGSASETKTDTKTETKTESKPESKPESKSESKSGSGD